MLGAGGMGVLYRAFDEGLNRHVAIKVLTSARLNEAGARERFAREARAAGGLKHPNIVTIYEYSDGPPPHLVMEFLEGCDLEQRLGQEPALSVEQTLDIIVQLCAALTCAHAQHIVHRDVKPANVWLQPDGLVRLLDFGIAKHTGRQDTAVGEALGSTPYMAPEQFKGDPVDGRADIFSTGVLLYQLLTGQRPFVGAAPAEVMLRIINGEYERLDRLAPGLPPELAKLATKALDVDPNQRHQSASELGAAVRAVRESLAAPAALLEALHVDPDDELTRLEADWDSFGPPPAPSSRRIPLMAAGTVAVGTALVVVQLLARAPEQRAMPSPSVARVEASTSPVPAPTATASVLVESEPAGAGIHLDGWDTGLRTPARIDVITTALPDVRLVRGGYRDGRFRLAAADVVAGAVTHRLEAQQARVTLVVTAPYPVQIVDGAAVVAQMATNHKMVINAPRTLRLRAPDYLLNQLVAIDPGTGRREVTIGRPGRLTVRAGETCLISIDGNPLGYPPLNNRLIAAGQHILQAECPELERRVITISPGVLRQEVMR